MATTHRHSEILISGKTIVPFNFSAFDGSERKRNEMEKEEEGEKKEKPIEDGNDSAKERERER